MADDQGLNISDGQFARQRTGRAVKALLANTGPETRRLPPLDSAPANPEQGDLAYATTNWDPDADGAAELVIYDGAAWVEIVAL